MRELQQVEVTLCDKCLDGVGGECHTPGCALWMSRAPDVSLRDRVRPGDQARIIAAALRAARYENGGGGERAVLGWRSAADFVDELAEQAFTGRASSSPKGSGSDADGVEVVVTHFVEVLDDE